MIRLELGKAELANAILYTADEGKSENICKLEQMLDAHMREASTVVVELRPYDHEEFTKLEVSLMVGCLESSRDSIRQKLTDGVYVPENLDLMRELLADIESLMAKGNRIWKSMKVEEDK